MIAVAQAGTGKQPLFSVEERISIIQQEVSSSSAASDSSVDVQPFDGLLTEFALKIRASIVLRGLRVVSDFENEFLMEGMNKRLHPEIETIFMMASEPNQFIASRFVKEIARMGGDVSSFVGVYTARCLRERLTQSSQPDAG